MKINQAIAKRLAAYGLSGALVLAGAGKKPRKGLITLKQVT